MKLFRGKRVTGNKEFVIGNYAYDSRADEHLIINWTEQGESQSIIDQKTRGQHIEGLLAKNGVMIFEGDLCKVPVEINKQLHGEYAIYQFTIKNGITMLSYVRSEKDTGIPEGYLSCPFYDKFYVDMKTIIFANSVIMEDCEIIGNIHEQR